MPRRPRVFVPGVVAHLTTRGIDDQPIFTTDLDRMSLLSRLAAISRRIDWRILVWCWMTTHYHVLVVVGRDTRVSEAMQWLNGSYAREYNLRHGRRGHLFGARYSDWFVDGDTDHLDASVGYVLDNPVRAGLVTHYDEWTWSGVEALRPRHPLRTPLRLHTRPPTPHDEAA